jgi:hypothetical protein
MRGRGRLLSDGERTPTRPHRSVNRDFCFHWMLTRLPQIDV